MRQFIYTDDWTVPIDEIKRIKYGEEKVVITISGMDLYVRCSNVKERYQDIQRQLMEAERSN